MRSSRHVAALVVMVLGLLTASCSTTARQTGGSSTSGQVTTSNPKPPGSTTTSGQARSVDVPSSSSAPGDPGDSAATDFLPSEVNTGDGPETEPLPSDDPIPTTEEAIDSGDYGNVTGGWVASGPTLAVYIQWTQDSGGNLTGTYDQSTLSTDGTSVEPTHATITGVISGYQITLQVAGGLGARVTMTGTIDDEVLRLSYPGEDGKLGTSQLIPGGTADYNARVATLQDAAASGAEDAAESEAAQQSANAQAAGQRQLQLAVDTAANTLAYDVGNASYDTGSVDNDLSNLSGTLETLTSDAAELRTNLDTLTSDLSADGKGSDTVCFDAGNLDLYLESVATDHQNVLDAESTSSAQALRDRIATIKADRKVLSDAVSAAGGYTSDNAPTDADVDSALTAVDRKLQAWVSAYAAAKERSKTVLAKAKSDVAAAKAKSGC